MLVYFIIRFFSLRNAEKAKTRFQTDLIEELVRNSTARWVAWK